MEEDKLRLLKLGEKGAYLSIVAYICLACLKLFTGYMADSEALKADGLNNTTDIIASVAVLIGLKLARRPVDKRHQYGHWKNETIASMVASFIMMTVGIQVLLSSITSFMQAEQSSPPLAAGYVGFFSCLVMYLVYRHNKKLALKINSQAVMAAAKGNITDAWVSIATTIGIVGAQFHMAWLDGLTACIVGIFICKTAWDIFKESSHLLNDGFDEQQLNEYKESIAMIKEVKAIKEIKGRSYGNHAVVDLVVYVHPTWSLQQAHELAIVIEKLLKKQHGVYEVYVRVVPYIK